MQKRPECVFKKKKGEQLVLERDEQHYISVWLLDEKGEKRAALYVKYYLRESLNIEDIKSFSVHLQTVRVDRKYRRRGIGTLMMHVLIEELLEIEQEEKCQFTIIQGEIGNVGGDNPRLSKPFYRSLEGMKFGKERKLILSFKRQDKGKGLEGFCYYIVKE